MAYTSKYSYALIGKESSVAYGTPVSCTKDIGLIQSVTTSEDNSIRRVGTLGQRNAHAITAGRFNVPLSVEGKFQNGRLLGYAIGTTATTGSTDYKHTFTEADSLSSFTFELGHNATSDVVKKYSGCKINNYNLSLNVDGELTFKTDIIAQNVVSSTTASASVTDDLAVFPAYMASISTGADGAESALGGIVSLDINIRNTLNPVGKIGSRLIQALQANNREYEINFTKEFPDDTEYNRFLEGGIGVSALTGWETGTPTIPSVIVNITNGIGAGSGLRQVYLKLANCSYSATGEKVTVGEYVQRDFTIVAKNIVANYAYSYDDIASGSWE